MTGVLVVGLIVGRVLSKDAVQKKASLFAFISLFLALAAFCVSVIMYSQTWAIPLFIIASMLVPIAVYGITASLVTKKGSERAADKKPTTDKKSLPAETKVPSKADKTAAKTMTIPRAQPPVPASAAAEGSSLSKVAGKSEKESSSRKTPATKQPAMNMSGQSTATDSRATTKKPDKAYAASHAKQEAARSSVTEKIIPVLTEKMPGDERVSTAVPYKAPSTDVGHVPVIIHPEVREKADVLPAREERIAREERPVARTQPIREIPKYEDVLESRTKRRELKKPAATASSATVSVSGSTEPLVGQSVSDAATRSRVKGEAAEVRSAGLRDVPAAERAAVQARLSDIAPVEPSVPAPATQSVALTFESCCAKAQALKEKGVHPVAARLFEESSRLTKNPAEAQKALLDAVNCHVKANNLKEAKRIAVALQDNCETLGPVEALKLNLVLRAD